MWYIQYLIDTGIFNDIEEYLELEDVLMMLFTDKELQKFLNTNKKFQKRRQQDCKNLIKFIKDMINKMPKYDGPPKPLKNALIFQHILRFMIIYDQMLFCFENTKTNNVKSLLGGGWNRFIDVVYNKFLVLNPQALESLERFPESYPKDFNEIYLIWSEQTMDKLAHLSRLKKVKEQLLNRTA